MHDGIKSASGDQAMDLVPGLWRARPPLSRTLVTALAGAMALVMAVTVVGELPPPLESPVAGWDVAADGARGSDGGAAPRQRWDGASDTREASRQQANRKIPASQRSRHPQHSLPQQPTVPPNKASVQQPPAKQGRGYQPSTSQELAQERDARRQVYANADGTQTTVFSTAPVNYPAPGGGWAPIDPKLTADANSGWRNKADAMQVRLAARADAPAVARFALADGKAVSYGLAGAAPVPGRADGALVTYRGVLPGVDLELESRPGALKETLVLRSADAPRVYDFPLRLEGLTATLHDGAVRLSDASGTVRAVIPPGYVIDSAPVPVTSTAVSYQLLTVGGKPTLRVSADDGWLRDPARVYPVRLDPTVALPVAEGAADSAMYVHGAGSASGSSELRVGTVDGANAASYVRFGGLVDRLRYHTIYGAQLQVVNYDADSCRAREVTVHPVTASWSAGTGYSYPGPAVGAALASKSFAHGFVAFGEGSSACPAAAEAFDLGGAGGGLVQRWVNGEQPNHGLSLRASADPLSGKRFTGPATANPPRLYVTHSPYNASYEIPKPVPNPPVLQNQDGKVAVTVTNRSAEAWAAGAYYLAYRAYNSRTGAAVTQQRAANLAAPVARGAKVTLDATIKALPPGRYFLDFTMVRTGGAVFTDHQVPPGRIVLEVIDIAPVVQELYPPNGYAAPTLAPQLWARAVDIDAPPGLSLSYKFEVCERTESGGTTGCFDSGFQARTAWAVPAGRLHWSKTYQWRVIVKDAGNEVSSPSSVLRTAVPQPEITSRIAGATTAAGNREFDAQTGNVSTSAVDATVTTVGPQLNLARTYNSLDPRRDGAFGAGWSTHYDMRVVADADGSGNVLVTYPDGQQVRFGRNPDGTFAAPSGRTASLIWSGTTWTLVDKSRMTYQFSAAGRLTKITDAALRSIVLTYNAADGKLARARVSNSQTNTAGRSLTFTWSGAHVSSVAADAVNGTAPTWTYTYSGDLLTSVCAPGNACTRYAYAAGSHYRTGVLDAKPESYWRLGEPQGTAAGSEVAVNLGKDAGTHTGVTLGVAGALTGTANTAATFNGTSSAVDLPKGAVKKARDGAVELWFKSSTTGSGGPLLGYQDKALSATSTTGVPVLYVGTDGLLRGQFGGPAIAPLTSTVAVNDGRWHHVVLSAMGGVQTLYLDGAKMAERAGTTIEHSLLTFNQLGAAYATTPASWPGWGTTARRYFTGAIDEVAVYSHPLGQAAVTAHFQYATGTNQLTAVTLPSGKTAAQFTYDTATGRVTKHTDRHGGAWNIGAPLVYGGDTDLRRSVQVLDPGNRPHLYEYDAISGQLLRSGTPLGLETREEDRPGSPTPPPPPPPTEVCSTPDPGDPSFCTVIPGDAGGPVFVRHPLDGMAIRTFEYDDRGNQTVVTNENGDAVRMGHDKRGNVISKQTCRTAGVCHTTYTTYPATVTDQFDPRNDLPTESRDGRSASATDSTYRTSYTHTSFGELATQVNPDGSTVRHTWTTGGEAAYGGGTVPAGLLLTTTDARAKITRYAYYQNGDLYRVTKPSGLVTTHTYDALGRMLTATETSDAYPAGVVTSHTYDALSRVVGTTEPATTDAVTGQAHQKRSGTTYDVDGNVSRVEVDDVRGDDPTRTSTWEYDQSNRPTRITDAEGNETVKNYDRFGNETSVVDANGNRYDYAYTARNALAEVRLRAYAGDEGPTTGDYLVLHTYAYDHAGRMASDTDAMGRRLEYQYYGDDQLHRLVLKNFRKPDGGTRDYVVEENTYDGAGNRTRQVAANGTSVTQQTYTRTSAVASIVVNPGGAALTTSYTYDAMGNVTRVTHTGRGSNVPWTLSTTPEQVDYAYDDSGNPIRQTAVAGTVNRVTTSTYDQRGMLTAATDPLGRTIRYDHDELGRRIRVTAPSVAAEENGGTPSNVTPTTVTGYNTFDETAHTADARGNVTSFAYNRVGRPVGRTAPTYSPPAGLSPLKPTTTARYDAAGNVVETVDARGSATRYQYDQLGRLVSRDAPSGATDRAVTRYTYTRTGQLLSMTGPTGNRSEATYDDLDRQVTATVLERYPTARALTTNYRYDDGGNVTSVVSPSGATTSNVYDALGQLTRVVDPAGVATSYGYDYAGRQVRVSDGLGRTERIDYDQLGSIIAESDVAPDGSLLRSQTYGYDAAGNLTSAVSPAGATTSYEYDALGRLARQVEPATASTSISTSFGYDVAGNPTRYTDGRGNRTISTYNSWGLLESQIEPATTAHPNATDRTWTVAYNIAGQPTRLTSPGAVTRIRSYDTAGRLTSETGTGAGTPERALGYDLAGRLVRATALVGTDTYSWDDRGNLLGSAGRAGTASFSYDADSQLVSRIDGSGTSAYTYTKQRLTAARDGVTGVTQRYTYDAAGQPTSIDYGSGRTRAFTYDNLARVTTDVTRNQAGQSVSSVSYAYDVDDKLVGKTTTGTAGAGKNTYAYDLAGRLTSWTGPQGTVAYAWDASGNRIRAGAKTASYDERNRLLSDSDYTYTYTARGTLASRTSSGLTEKYAFDAFDRLTAAGSVTYAYDALNRVAARGGSSFGYAGMTDDVVTDGAGRYSRGPTGEVLGVGQGTEQLLALTDGHGDVVAGIDPADSTLGKLADSKAYDPFGKVVATEGDPGDLGFQGDWTDPTTGQVDMGARWYEPGTGAFVSRDPVNYSTGDAILANRYTYAAGDPLAHIDPDGYWPSCSWCKSVVNKVKKVASTVWSGAKRLGSRAWSVVRTGASAVVSGIRSVTSWVGSVIRSAAVTISNGARWLYNKARTAVNWISKKIRTTTVWIASKVSRVIKTVKGGVAAAATWARKKAEQAQAAFRVAQQRITQRAREVIEQVVRYNPIPTLAAVLKPVVSTIRTVVSVAVHIPAAVVATVRDVVADTVQAAEIIYQAAVEAAGTVVEAVSTATEAVVDFAEAAAPYVQDALNVVADAVGVTDLVDCVTKGDLEACAWTAATVAGFALGGVGGGAVRAARAARLVAQHGDEVAGALRGGTRLPTTRRVDDAADVASCATGNSFTGDTLVRMADGSTKPISKVDVGEKVLSTDPTTGRAGAFAVTAVIVGEGRKELVEVEVDTDGVRGSATATVTATEGHPFWSTERNTWVEAGDLAAGEELRTSAGGTGTVLATRERTERKRVYNLTVDTTHTFYVLAGALDLLVHNTDAGCPVHGPSILPESTTGTRPPGRCNCGDSKLDNNLPEVGRGPNGAGYHRGDDRMEDLKKVFEERKSRADLPNSVLGEAENLLETAADLWLPPGF
ncbi:RHS repeat-associated core domain-containing protein [Micromonospora peucetia]|uniref:Intein C-terminal splicing region/RHS repeat-associated core domain-containing protein n=1 Tax=Micromonospora peucetia TaxID=47871 RepID=A0A1C6W4D0_9ACTN|nr:RHS repeat-associated core domain-containing protein [Micromonospora peucetia]SCL73361.1 intein C-terminal splicing region/RHS repeat-associated core domain-containing protein [Micromonospora peucetia]